MRTLILALVLVLGLSGCTALDDSPERELAERYLQAIVDGRYADAWQLTEDSQNYDADEWPVVPDAAAATAEGRIDDFTIDEVDEETGAATVTLKAGADSRQVTLEVDLDAGLVGDVHTWRLLGAMQAPRSAPVTINGSRLAFDPDPIQPISVFAPPGTWMVSVEVDELLEVEPTTWAIGLHDPLTRTEPAPLMTARLSEAGEAHVNAQLDEWLADCLTDRDGRRSGCPNQLPSSLPVDPGSVQWSMVGDPAYSWDEFQLDQAIGDVSGVTWTATWTEGGEPRDGTDFTWNVGPPTARYYPDGRILATIPH
ncbi:hypothetical protein [Parenemella sanctibonifatiensis]|uniref:Uncharacterized protein n=1 Tax=Parenemella sanctibonifatiensis TaxID=2016505 RepID=A0A255E911_9ACTN|nr:hypothetical protein [Parenemella sanctibonifatiensis]OYN88057.1 hypothetical protein CGZ92_05425 [Parenemella sanctibonifatiensis]